MRRESHFREKGDLGSVDAELWGGNSCDRVHLGEVHSQGSTGKAGRKLLGWGDVIVADERGGLKMRELVQPFRDFVRICCRRRPKRPE